MKQLATILAVGLMACSSTPELKKDSPKLNAIVMAEAMAGIAMHESATSFNSYNDTITPLLMGIQGQKVLDSLGISREDFQQSITYYQNYPKEFLPIFDSAVAHLEKLKKTTLKRNGEY